MQGIEIVLRLIQIKQYSFNIRLGTVVNFLGTINAGNGSVRNNRKRGRLWQSMGHSGGYYSAPVDFVVP